MDKLTHHRQLIQTILTNKADLVNQQVDENMEAVVAFDERNDVYLLQYMGWRDVDRIWDTNIFIRLLNGKIWIEEDWTEEGVATDLLENGVAKDEIVLAFHHPRVRPLSEFAIA